MIGIIGAMDLETAGILDAMTVIKTEKIGFSTFWQGRIGTTEVVLAQCGIGKVFAAACTQAMILKYAPTFILNIGVGGALTRELGLGDAVVGTSAVQYDMDTSAIGDPPGKISGIDRTYLPCDEAAGTVLGEVLSGLGVHHLFGVIATADRFVDKDENRDLCRSFGALIEDMEGAAVGQVCFVHQLPFGILRTVSNGDEDAGAVYENAVGMAAEVLSRATVEWAKKC